MEGVGRVMSPGSPTYNFSLDPDTGFFRMPDSEWFWIRFFDEIDWKEIS